MTLFDFAQSSRKQFRQLRVGLEMQAASERHQVASMYFLMLYLHAEIFIREITRALA